MITLTYVVLMDNFCPCSFQSLKKDTYEHNYSYTNINNVIKNDFLCTLFDQTREEKNFKLDLSTQGARFFPITTSNLFGLMKLDVFLKERDHFI